MRELRFLPAVLLLGAAAPGEEGRMRAATAASGCEIDQEPSTAAMLRKVPGQPDATLQALVTLSGGADDQTLGELCIALVRERGGRFAEVAKLSGEPISPPSGMDPVTSVRAGILPTPFRFKPGETAFGVEATGEYVNQSTSVGFTTLYLLRPIGDRIVPIFQTRTWDSLTDKTDPDGNGHSTRWIVRFDTILHDGAFDLLLQRYHGGTARRFRWNGVHYRAVDGRG